MKKVINLLGWLSAALFLLLMFAPNHDAIIVESSPGGEVKYQRQSILYQMNRRIQDNVINRGIVNEN